MARSTKSYEERMLQLEKKEQESLEKAKQYAAQKRELKKRQKDVETKKRTHRLCQIGGAVESVLGSAIEEDDIPKLIGFLKRQEANGRFFSKAMQKEPVANTEEVPADYKEISFVCLRPDGSLELPSTLGIACRSVSKKLEGFEDFHFHQLRHTYTSNLLSNGAAPKDVQELLGHSDVSTTMNIYAHSTRKAKRDSARLLDKVASNA